MKPYSAILHQPTITPAILSSFTAEGLTREKALTQPRRAEVILRHDPFAPSPYIVTLSSPAFAFGGWGVPVHKDQVWDFATFDEAREWFDELFDANVHMIVDRQRPPKREPHNGTIPWKVGDAAALRRLVPYHLCSARTESRLNWTATPLQTSILGKRQRCEDALEKRRAYGRCRRSAASTRHGAVPLPTPRQQITVVTPLSTHELASNCESFFSFGNC